jgi:hypothetical protein
LTATASAKNSAYTGSDSDASHGADAGSSSLGAGVPGVENPSGNPGCILCRGLQRGHHLSLMSDETKALTWYLGYGSNMNRGIFESRRGMRPIRAHPALLENYRLRFNLAVGPGERGVANLESQTGAHTWGVLYLITVDQSEHLDRTEGVPRGARIPAHSN